MKAILTINHMRLLVPCAKKGLAFVEFLQSAKIVSYPLEYRPNEVLVEDEPLSLGVETVKPTNKIVTRTQKARR